MANDATPDHLTQGTGSQDPFWVRYLLWGILGVAAILRLWGIDYGLPYEGLTYNQVTYEESMEVLRAFKLGAGEYSWSFGKGGLYYLLFFEYGVLFVVSWLLGWVSDSREFALQIIEDRTTVYLMGRLTVALMGVLTCLVIYTIGKRLYDWRVGLVAALIGATAYFHTVTSTVINVDIGMTLALWASVLVYLVFEENQKLRFLVGAGALGGVAVAFKLPGIIILPLILLAIASVPEKWRHPRQILKEYGMFVGALFVTLTVIAPEWIPSIRGTVYSNFSGILDPIFAVAGSIESDANDDLRANIRAITIFSERAGYLQRLLRDYNLALTVSALLGLGLGLWRRHRWDIIWGIFIVVLVGVMSLANRSTPERYLLPIVPALWLLGSRAVVALSSRHWSLTAGGLAIVVSIPLIGLARHSVEKMHPDTRLLAKQWIETNVPSGQKILMDGMRYRFIPSPPLNPDRRTVARQVRRAGDEGANLARGVSHLTLTLYQEAMERVDGPTYELHSTSHGLDVEAPSYYVDHCFDYIVTSSYIARRFDPDRHREDFPESARFYALLKTEPQFRLAYQATAIPWNSSGPTISVYEVIRHVPCDEKERL